jgi:hypothetical protein
MRQAATPTHTVSVSDVTSRNMKENWLNCAPQTELAFFEKRARSAESENAAMLT